MAIMNDGQKPAVWSKAYTTKPIKALKAEGVETIPTGTLFEVLSSHGLGNVYLARGIGVSAVWSHEFALPPEHGTIKDPVECPRCKGSSRNPEPGLNAWMVCRCCDGAGKIEKAIADALPGIKRDIARRLTAAANLAQ